ncbi:MAG TPA: hypothetical protein VLJ14_10220 [Ktedonobacterales bacterium]|nr:hypothetical protein [Ktedonobacterales bacterium]
MLTAAVNIAVFAAFWQCAGHAIASNPEFKGICRVRELDVSCYGWQKRQETARGMATDGTVGGNNGNVS